MKRHKILYFITLILLVINIVNASEDLPLVQILNKTPEDSIRVISYKMELNFSSNQMFKITTINLCNLSNREINCLLALQLSENEYVYDIAIEIDSLLRHGIIFENNLSYNLYEKYYDNNEIVQKIYRSLKNIYQLPIKDFNGNSYKKIQIKSKKNLPLIDNKFKYFLELKYSTICDTFQFIVKSSDKPVKTIYRLNNQEKILVSNEEKIFDKNNIMNFSVEAEVNFNSRMYFNVEDNKKYFHIIDTNKIEKRPKVLPRKLCIYWDVSASNSSVKTNLIIEIIEKYIRKIGRVTVLFSTFNDFEISKKRFRIKDGNCNDLEKYILHLDYFGISRFDNIKFNEQHIDEYILVSDGKLNFGNVPQINSNKKVYCISNKSGNVRFLKEICKKSNSQFIDCEGDMNILLNKLLYETSRYNIDCQNCEFIVENTNDQYNTISGFVENTNEINLEYGFIDNKKYKKFRFEKAILSNEITRNWGEKLINKLNNNSLLYRDSIIKISKKWSIPSDFTNLIILYDLYDYYYFDVPIPTDLYLRYKNILKSRNIQCYDYYHDKDINEKLSGKYYELQPYIKWWNSDFKDQTQYYNRFYNNDFEKSNTVTKFSNLKYKIQESKLSNSCKVSGILTSNNDGLISGSIILYKEGIFYKGTITDFDGRFDIDIDEGNYELEVKYVGYKTLIIKDINILPQKNYWLNLELVENYFDVDLSINYYSYRRFKCEYFKQEKCKVTIPEIINDSLLKKLDRNNDYDKNLLKDRKLLKSNSIERIIFEADSLFNNGNKELAASKINSLVDLNDQTPELIRIAAYKLESYKMYRKAEEIYKYILKINPSNINSYLDVANILIDQKKYNESYEVLKKGLDIIENTNFQIKDLNIIIKKINYLVGNQLVKYNSSNIKNITNLYLDQKIDISWNNPYVKFRLNINKINENSSKDKENFFLDFNRFSYYSIIELESKIPMKGNYTLELLRTDMNYLDQIFLRIYKYKNYGKPNQTKEVQVVKLDKYDFKMDFEIK